MDDFAQTYAAMSDQELRKLARERDTLRRSAQVALDNEITKRQLDLAESGTGVSQEAPAARRPMGHVAWATFSLLALGALGRALDSVIGIPLVFLAAAIFLGVLISKGLKSWVQRRPMAAMVISWLSLPASFAPWIGFIISTVAYRVSDCSKYPSRARAIAVAGYVLSLLVLAWKVFLVLAIQRESGLTTG
jgi:hypothetical protein